MMRTTQETRWRSPPPQLSPKPSSQTGESGGSAGRPGCVTSSDVSLLLPYAQHLAFVVTCSPLTIHTVFEKFLTIWEFSSTGCCRAQRRTLNRLFYFPSRACFSSSANRITATCGKATAQKMPSYGKERKYLPG